jgi:hypothetical protein
MSTILVRKTDWILRKAQGTDRESIIASFKNNLWQAKSNADALYQWKFEKNPAGQTLALIGVNQENRVVATSMFMPAKLVFNNTILKACQWVDLFVELEYRGQPLPSQSLQRGLEEFRRSGAPVCFAFPNDNSVPLHRKNNGIHLGLILRYTKPLNAEYLVARKIKNKFFSKLISVILSFALRLISKETYLLASGGFSVERAEYCGEEFNELWYRFSKALAAKVMVCKDSAYLNWKYLKSPNPNRQIYALRNNKELDGFVVLESTARIGYIVDIAAVSQNAFDHLIAFSLKIFRKQGKDSAVFAALENNMYFPHFKSFGFVERPEVKHFYIYLADNVVNKEYLQDSRNWFITIGDCDIERLSND